MSIWILLFSFLLLPLQVSNQSLWIDEGDTAQYALQPDLHSWGEYLVHETIPNCQMPLSMWVAWSAAQTLGSAEWQLRAVNLLWAGGALLAMFFAGRILGCSWLPALLALQPYFWFYDNEARPYALEIFCGTLLVLGVAIFCRDRGQGARWAWTIAGGAVLLGYATMLAPFPLFATTAICAGVAYRGQWRISRQARVPLLLGFLMLVPIGLYYLWTILRGVSFPVLWKSDWKGFCYLFYELTGLSGLGPSLLELREAAQTKLLPAMLSRHWPELTLAGFAAIAWALLLLLAVRSLARAGRWHLLALFVAIPLLAGASLTVTGLVMKKMLWARHWAPLFPFYVAAMALALKAHVSGGSGSRRLGLALASAWVVLLAVSAFSLRFSDKHRKDDYRAAAALAKEYLAHGHPVWWAASRNCALYYGLPAESAADSLAPQCYKVEPRNLTKTDRPLPPVIFLSRPSIYDPAGSIRSYAARNQMTSLENRCRAFWIYLPPTAP